MLFANTFELLEVHIAFDKLLQRALASKTGRVLSPVFEKSLDCFTAYVVACRLTLLPVLLWKLGCFALKRYGGCTLIVMYHPLSEVMGVH